MPPGTDGGIAPFARTKHRRRLDVVDAEKPGERFVEHAPNSGDAATAPIDDAAAWIAEIAKDQRDVRLLAVVHARGAHPPWDVTAKELAALQPVDYGGLIEPRRAAQQQRRAFLPLPP